jgi:hypothetical protein
VCQASALEPVLPNVPDPTEPSELVVGIDAEAAAVDAQKGSDAVTEPVNVIQTVRTNTVDLMAVEVNVASVRKMPSVKDLLIFSHNNATSTAISKCPLKSENSKPKT